MPMTRKGKALKLALSALSPKMAQDAALPDLVANAGNKDFDRNALLPKLHAMDEGVDKEALLEVVEAIVADDPAEDSEEETEAEKKAREKKEADDKDKDKKAMDAAINTAVDAHRAELRAADEARRLVRPIVGEVFAEDSAAGIYTLALKTMDVKHDGITDANALKAIFNAANANRPVAAPVVAMDSATAATMFPHAFTIRKG